MESAAPYVRQPTVGWGSRAPATIGRVSTEPSVQPEGARSRFPLDTVYQAARMYYLEDATQAEIADRLGVSRPTVSRLVSEARRAGLVRIEVVDPFRDETVALAAELRDALGLRAVRLAAVTHQATLGADLAAPVAAAIEAMASRPVTPSWSPRAAPSTTSRTPVCRRCRASSSSRPSEDRPTPNRWFQTNEITRAAAERSGAIPAFLFAPALPSETLRASLDDDPAFQHVVGLWRRAKGALLGIGAPVVTRHEIARAACRSRTRPFDRAAGDVCLNFFAADGSAVEFPGSDRMGADLPRGPRGRPHAVGVAVGPGKGDEHPRRGARWPG